MKLKLNTLVVLLLSLFVLSSCGSKNNKGKSDEFGKTKSLGEEIRAITYNIPDPTEIPYLLMQTGAAYDQSLLNPLYKVDEYGSQMDKAALNLGVFAADIGYLVSYEKTQESLDYLTACKRLADNLGVTDTFDPATLQQFELNIGNKDSLASLLNDAISRTDEYLKGNSQSKLGALMITGSFVESLYIATELIRTYPKDAFKDPKQKIQLLIPLMQIVLNQHTSIKELSTMLRSVDQTGSVPSIIKDLIDLDASYTALNMEGQVEDSTPNLQFNDTTLEGITKVVGKLRADITK